MKLYYWNDLSALCNYTNGQAFALADSKEDAISAIIDNAVHCFYSKKERRLKQLEDELNQTDPSVFDSTVGFAIEGRD